MITQTCITCRTSFTAYWRGVEMPERCRRCEHRHAEKARRAARSPRDSDVRPKHVVGEFGTEGWYHSQQTAFALHMGRLGIPKTGARPSDSYSSAGERPVAGLGGRF